jgi:hypothetical protein
MNKTITVATVLLLCAGVAYLAFAAEPMGKEMMSKPMMGKNMMPMCPMHAMMCQSMMEKKMIALEDGSIVIMAGGKLCKYDKDLNLVKEVELKVDQEIKAKIEQMQKECMEKCQTMMKEEGEKTGSM